MFYKTSDLRTLLYVRKTCVTERTLNMHKNACFTHVAHFPVYPSLLKFQVKSPLGEGVKRRV